MDWQRNRILILNSWKSWNFLINELLKSDHSILHKLPEDTLIFQLTKVPYIYSMGNSLRLLSFGVLVIHFYMVHGLHACEKYRFVQEQDKEFKDHVITAITTPYVETCWAKCVWIMNCFSINVRNTSFGTVKCELNNSSKKASPESLVPTQGSQYHQFGVSFIWMLHLFLWALFLVSLVTVCGTFIRK